MRFTDTEGCSYDVDTDRAPGGVVGRIRSTDRAGVVAGDIVKVGDAPAVRRESELAARLGHHVVPAMRLTGRIAAGPHEGRAFLVVEHVGPDLATVLDEVGNLYRERLSAEHTDRLALDLLDALAEFEKVGIEATQLRPEHVLLSEDPANSVRLCGLSGAWAGEVGECRLPPMVPESQPWPGRTHLYLWARTVEAVLGTGAASSNDTALRHAITCCSSIDPSLRPASAQAVRDMVTAPMAPPPTRPVIDVVEPPPPPGVRERAGLALAASEKPGLAPDLRMAVLAVALVLGLVLGLTASGLMLGR